MFKVGDKVEFIKYHHKEEPYIGLKAGDIGVVTYTEERGCEVRINDGGIYFLLNDEIKLVKDSKVDHMIDHGKTLAIRDELKKEAKVIIQGNYSKNIETFNAVDHPSHYNKGKYEVIDVIEDWKLDFHLANAIKYIARAEHKNNYKEDIEKAIWYLERRLKNDK